jgi:3-deoxy-7-phosphoheptulonate synthase
MILHTSKEVQKGQILEKLPNSLLIENEDSYVIITSSKIKKVPVFLEKFVTYNKSFETDIQLSSKDYINKREIKISDDITLGDNKNTLVISGPCSVESEDQILNISDSLVDMGIKVIRGGCYKPRTSPYTFQGMGLDGLKLLDKVRKKHGVKIITEVRDSSHIEEIIEYSDIIQIGAKSMYDHSILKRCGDIKKPVMLKRGFGTTLQEFVQASEFILSRGNENVILCERGIRTFETKTRFTLDLCGVSWLKEHTNLPIILDPSHAIGFSYGVPDLTRACVAMGIDGVIIETHNNPKIAKSDASQQLNLEEFREMYNSISKVANSINKKII